VTYSVRNIAIAVVLAIAAAAAVLVYTTSYRQSITRGQARVNVFVATRDIPAGTPFAQAQDALKSTAILADDKTPGALTSTAGMAGKVASQTVFAGQQVVSAVFATSTTQAPALSLSKTERAVRIMCDPDPSCLIGDIQAGDKVDVFETVYTRSSKDATIGISRLLLHGVRVLDVPAVDPKKGGGLSATAGNTKNSVLIAIDQSLAAKFTWLEGFGGRWGQIWLAVRPPDSSAQDGPPVVETVGTMVFDGLSAGEIAKISSALGLQPNGKVGG
jgi:Flp pilus assembly protein CpaB